MGNCFSDPSHKPNKGQGQKLGSAPANAQPQPSSQIRPNQTQKNTDPPRTLGGENGTTIDGLNGGGDPRERALKAAEERAKLAQSKGVNVSNPKAGQLSAKLAAENRSKPSSPPPNDNRMMDRGEWN
ncbi:uncharacterized protein L201_005359 [Kwoniella dendrophila CBS 6074]|uniref:SMP domain-containing protein n=1 Tax=Kwoniella dendrophila CBS 6074 TaxID=1295534 RepID=A0AAX4JZV4_9TREE